MLKHTPGFLMFMFNDYDDDADVDDKILIEMVKKNIYKKN